MNISILNMQLLNFKGVRNLNVDFGHVTNILGDNGTGKTTVFDAFTWLLFGKNSEDAKDFNVKTLDKDNNPIHRLEHEVKALLDVDGRRMSFRRVFREKWVKKRGSADSEFTGHETELFVDDIPLSQKEYQARVDFVMNESIAKMITSPTYFNSLKWQDRRGVLEAMAGTISNSDIAGNNYEFQSLLAAIGNEKFVDFKKKIGAQKSRIKENLSSIPARIDEAERSKPEPQDYNFLENERAGLLAEIKALDEAIEDSTKAYQLELDAINKKQLEKHQMQTKLQELKLNAGSKKRSELAKVKAEISGIEAELKSEEQSIKRNEETIKNNAFRIESLSKRNEVLRSEWIAKNSEQLTIDEHAMNCPTCKQALPEDQQTNTRETLTANFNSSKKAALDKIDMEGQNNKKMIAKLQEDNQSLEGLNQVLHGEKIEKLKNKLFSLQKDVEIITGWPENESPEAAELQKQIDLFVVPGTPEVNNSELKAKKQKLSQEVSEIEKRLAAKGFIENINTRISELEKSEKELSQELANLERMEFTMAEFSKARIESIEKRINDKFKLVKFKMFEQQINGGEVECCECMVNGVPYSDVNTSGKIQAGIDIINALTDHYKINAPVFIDNRESIVKLPECKSQIINLIVKEGQKLTVETEVTNSELFATA